MSAHTDFSGLFPWHTLSFDPTTKPAYYPVQVDPKVLVPWWWRMTQMRLVASVSFTRSMTGIDSPDETDVLSGDYSCDKTVAVVPDITAPFGLRAERSNVGVINVEDNSFLGLGCIGFDTATAPDTWTMNHEVSTRSGSHHSTTDYLVGCFLGLFPQTGYWNYWKYPHFEQMPSSSVIVDPDGKYWPALIFGINNFGGFNAYPLSGIAAIPDIFVSTVKTTPIPLNSGGDPASAGFPGGVPWGTVGSLIIHDVAGDYTIPLYGYTGSYVPAAGSSISGSDTLTVDVELTTIYT